MPSYQRYQPRYSSTAPSSRRAGSRWGKIIGLVGVAIVLYLIIRAVLGGPGDPELVDGTNQPIVNDQITSEVMINSDTANSNENSNTNLNTNTNANSNANANMAVTTVEATSCDRVFSRGDATEKQVSLTFNVGTTKEGELSTVLQGLQSANVPADFFIRGDVAEENPELVTMIHSAGFPLYNLTYSHQRATDLSAAELVDELDTASAAISDAGGGTGKPFFRPPYGAADESVVETAADEGYCTVTWTVDALDWSTDYTAATSKQRVLDTIGNGAIILMQAANATTAEIIPGLITELQNEGYEIVNLKTNLGL